MIFTPYKYKRATKMIERVYGLTRPDWEAREVRPLEQRKRISHSKNRPHNPEGIRKHLK